MQIAVFGVATLMVVSVLVSVLRQRTVEFNIATRHLSVVHQWSFGSPKKIFDCSFEECEAVGTAQYNNGEGGVSYGVYVQPKKGKRYAIPSVGGSFEDAATVARALTAATGIRRLDASF